MRRAVLAAVAASILTLATMEALASAAQESAAPQAKRITISIAPYRKNPTDANGKVVRYFEELYNVDFDLWNIDQSRFEELMGIRFASGEIPDVMDIRSPQLVKWQRQGVLAEIPIDLLKKNAPLSYQANVDAEPNFLKPGMIDGKLYSVQEVPPTDIRYPACVWRGDWLEKLGIQGTPDTLDAFEKALYRVAREDPDGNGKKDTWGISNMGMQSVMGAFGLSPDKWHRDGKGGILHGAVHPDMKRALALLAKWYKDGVIDPEFITGENYGGYWALSHAFINGRIGYTNQGGYTHWYPPMKAGQAGGANYEEIAKINPTAAAKLRYGVPPAGPEGKYGIFFSGESKPIVANVITAFGVQLDKDQGKFGRILYVLDQIVSSSFDSYVTSKSGIKGEDWTVNEDGAVQAIGKAAQDPAYVEQQGAGWNFRFFDNPAMAKRVNPVLYNWAMAHNYGQRIARHEYLTPFPSEGKYMTELNKIWDEARIAIVTGDKPLDYYDAFVAAWYKAGGEVLTKEANAWYKDFWK